MPHRKQRIVLRESDSCVLKTLIAETAVSITIKIAISLVGICSAACKSGLACTPIPHIAPCMEWARDKQSEKGNIRKGMGKGGGPLMSVFNNEIEKLFVLVFRAIYTLLR